jgi:putative ABC transport system substrate-binding protein
LRINLAASILAAVLVVASSLEAQAQKVWRIGWLQPVTLTPSFLDAVRQGLSDAGYVESRNLRIEYRWAEGKPERLPELAEELVRLKVDLLMSSNTQALQALKRATSTIPIVMLGAGDPVGTGLVDNLARPGGNITGTTVIAKELSPKRLELIKQLVPGLARVTYIANPANPLNMLSLKETEEAGRTEAVAVQALLTRRPDELGASFSSMLRSGSQALIVAPDGLFISERSRIVDFATTNRLPSIFFDRVFVDAGGLISYGPDFPDTYRRAVSHIDKIFRGAKPGDLPVERPTKIDLVVNLKAARAIGLTVPQSVLLQATDVVR